MLRTLLLLLVAIVLSVPLVNADDQRIDGIPSDAAFDIADLPTVADAKTTITAETIDKPTDAQ